MDKYELSMKIDEIKRLSLDGLWEKANQVLRTIPINRIKNSKDLFMIIDVYTETEQYDMAREVLLLLQKKFKSRRVIHQLIDISIHLNNVEDAKSYMKEFRKLAPNDPYNYVFEYRVAQLEGKPLEAKREILENLKRQEYIERWGYELAKLYFQLDEKEACIEECNQLKLWFGNGLYVRKADMIKQCCIAGHYSKEMFFEREEQEDVEPEVEDEKIDVKIEKSRIEVEADIKELVKEALTESEEAKAKVENSIIEDEEAEIEVKNRVQEIKNQKVAGEVAAKELEVEHEGQLLAEQKTNGIVGDSLATLKEPSYADAFAYIKEREMEESYKVASNRELKQLVKETTSIMAKEVFDLLENENADQYNEVGQDIQRTSQQEEIIKQEPVVDEELNVKQEPVVDEVETIRTNLSDEVRDILGHLLKRKGLNRYMIERLFQAYNSPMTLVLSGKFIYDMTYVAKRIAKALSVNQNIIQKVAIISGNHIADIDFGAYKDKISGGCIIIEDIQKCEDSLFEQINILHGMNCFVIAEIVCNESQIDVPKEYEKYFENVFHVSAYTKKELLGLVEDFINEKGYGIDEDALKYFQGYIDEVMKNQSQDIFCLIMEKITNAYHCAKQRNKVELRNAANSGNYKDAVFMSIRYQDFFDEN